MPRVSFCGGVPCAAAERSGDCMYFVTTSGMSFMAASESAQCSVLSMSLSKTFTALPMSCYFRVL